MITKEKFIKVITEFQIWYDRIDKVSDILNCFVLELDWVEYGASTFDNLISISFNEDGQDIINWWLFDKSNDSSLNIILDNKDLPSETVEDLWELVKDYRY